MSDVRNSDMPVRRETHTTNAVDWIALVLLIIGGINWGLVGLMDLDVVAAIFGPMTTVSRVIYALVGLSALYSIYFASRLGQKKV